MNIRTLSENAIQWIDIQMIHDILNEMRRRSGELEREKPPEIQILQKSVARTVLEKIVWWDKTWGYSSYGDNIKILTKKWEVNTQNELTTEFGVVFTFVHELIHAYWKVEWPRSVSDMVQAILGSMKTPWSVSRKVWYSFIKQFWIWDTSLLDLFNEWMTNWITISVIEEYYRRKWIKNSTTSNTFWYDSGMSAVMNLAEYLSQRIDVDLAGIMIILRQGYFSGLDIISILTDKEHCFWLPRENALKLLWESA